MREGVLNELEEAQDVEKTLAARMDELKRSIEQMGTHVGVQVRSALLHFA